MCGQAPEPHAVSGTASCKERCGQQLPGRDGANLLPGHQTDGDRPGELVPRYRDGLAGLLQTANPDDESGLHREGTIQLISQSSPGQSPAALLGEH